MNCTLDTRLYLLLSWPWPSVAWLKNKVLFLQKKCQMIKWIKKSIDKPRWYFPSYRCMRMNPNLNLEWLLLSLTKPQKVLLKNLFIVHSKVLFDLHYWKGRMKNHIWKTWPGFYRHLISEQWAPKLLDLVLSGFSRLSVNWVTLRLWQYGLLSFQGQKSTY